MKGSHRIIVETERMKYEFTIRRNITIILGNSATGKTTLVEFLNMYAQRGNASGVTVQSDVPCVVFQAISGLWQATLKEIKHSIIFIDEGQSFIFSQEFAEAVQSSDNYYVLITRRPLPNLAYSTKEIYGIRTTGKYHFPEKVYQEFYPIYERESLSPSDNGNVLIVEDSGSGLEFFQKSFPNIKCISAEGNSKISPVLIKEGKRDNIIVFADGAAFGAYIENVLSIREVQKNIGLFLPESFEWLILKSGIITSNKISDILHHPEEYIDSAFYFSWERFFTDILEKETSDNPQMRYSKAHISDYYISDRNIRKIMSVLPAELKHCMELSGIIKE